MILSCSFAFFFSFQWVYNKYAAGVNAVFVREKFCRKLTEKSWKSENRVVEKLGKDISLAIFQHSSFQKDAGSSRTSWFMGEQRVTNMNQKVGCRGRDGGIRQGISGISPRGELVNCSVGTGTDGGVGREQSGHVWVYQVGEQKWVLRERDRGNERKARARTQITTELRT